MQQSANNMNKNLPAFLPAERPPKIHPHEVYKMIKNTKKTKSTLKGDLPYALCQEFAAELAEPLSHIFNESLMQHEYPDIWKHEYVSPVPKEFPPESEAKLRKISGTFFFSKQFERFIATWIHQDIEKQLDTACYGGVKGMSTSHYMIKLVHEILQALDGNSKGDVNAVIATFYDWSKAFDMQDHQLGIESFIKCGVRSSLLPILVNYLQNRRMTVKYRTGVSTEKPLPGGGAQGTLLGPIEYGTQSNNSADCVSPNQRFKYVDDLTTIEVVSLLTKVASYNFKQHVASDVGTHNQIISNEEIETQEVIENINDWTINQKMKLNTSKTKYMILNFTDNYQFNTRIMLKNSILDFISQIKLLGVELSEDLTWKANTHSITKEAVRDQEKSYEDSLKDLGLESLAIRKEKLCTEFSKQCTQNPKTTTWFPKRNHISYALRNPSVYSVTHANTERFENSTIPLSLIHI